MSETQRERELTFDLPERWELPDVTRFVPDGGSVHDGTQRLESTYFDTAGRDLFGSLVTLRRRTGDADNGWHLKIPMGNAREEVRLPLGTGRGVPAELRTLTTGLRGRATLRAIATLRTERQVRRIVDAEGAGVVEIVHDTVTATVKHEFSIIRSWHEAEVELLVGGDEKLLARIAKWLGKHGAQPSASSSKLGRALEASARPARPTTTAAGVLSTYLDTNFAAIVAGDVTLRRDAVAARPADELPADELQEAVHATRVASRRYRSTLRTFAPLLDRDRAAAVDGELSWFASALGEVRDRHVLRKHLDTAFDELAPELLIGAVRRRVERTLDAEEAEARAAVGEVMASARYLALLAELRAWTADLPVHDADGPASTLERYVRRASATMDKRIAAAIENPDREHPIRADSAYHRARKAAKRARYAGELAVPALGASARQLAKRAKKRQERLGDRQDEVVAAEFLLRLGASGGDGFTLGVLYQRERDLAESAD